MTTIFHSSIFVYLLWQTGSRDRVCYGSIDQSDWIWRQTTGNYDSVRLKAIFTTIHKNN